MWSFKQALKYSLVLRKVYAVIKFKQRRRLEPYVSSNTYFWTIAENDFNDFTLLTNSVFGKSIQNERNNKKRKVRNEQASSTHFEEINFISENFQLIKKG